MNRIAELMDRFFNRRPPNEVQVLKARIRSLEVELREIEGVVRLIHEACKRGPATGDHGLKGNLACILDHVLPEPPPIF